MKFFFDNNLPPRLARALREVLETEGFEIVALREKFPEDAQDEIWLPALAAEGEWVIISGDQDILKNKQRRQVWIRAGLTTFFLMSAWTRGGMKLLEISWRLIKRWPEIIDLARTARRGSCFKVPLTGRIKRARFF